MKKSNVLAVLCLLCLAAWASPATPTETELVGCTAGPARVGNAELDARYAEPVVQPSSQPGDFCEPLEQMSAVERANAEIWLEPGDDALPGAREEAGEISRLWNSGSYEEALARMRGLHRFADPNRVAVAVNWRTPVETEQGSDWGPDIRIGNRDSLIGCMFDRASNGTLLAAFPKRGPSRTYLHSYRSTDSGSNWTELAYVYWNVADYLEAWSGACHGNYWQLSWVDGGTANRAWAARINISTGSFVNFPGDSLAVIPFQSASGDSIRELAVCTSEDVNPGSRIYLFGRTKNRLLYYAWTDSSCRGWNEVSTGVSYCDNGLDCTFNAGFDSNFIWVSWMRHFGSDSAKLAFGWRNAYDTDFHKSWFNNVYGSYSSSWRPTAITAYEDTIQMGFIRQGTRQVGQVYRRRGSNSWIQSVLSDSGNTRDVVEVTGRRGDGFAVGYRDYVGTGRDVKFRHAALVQGPYTDPEAVSENRPYPSSRIRIERTGRGTYGVVWVNWTDAVRQGAWFDRVTPTGIAGPEPQRPTPLGLRAMHLGTGVRLAFDNPVAGPFRVRVFDRSGRLQAAREGFADAGRQQADITLDAAGVYLVKVDAAGKSASTSFAFVR
jgi:hypothetical protein